MELNNSTRRVQTASYVETQLKPDELRGEDRRPNRAFQKLNALTAMHLEGSLRQEIARRAERLEDERTKRDVLAVLDLHQQLASNERTESNLALAPKAAKLTGSGMSAYFSLVRDVAGTSIDLSLIGLFERQRRIAPVGRLHLERLEMSPVGIERGEMVFTVPLAPKEQITISHKEWSVTNQEFENIVTDSFEDYSERGVSEKSDASMSTESDAQHSRSLNFNAAVSGGYGPVTVSTSLGLNTGSSDHESVKKSAQTSREITQKASARTRQEHKVSVKLEAKKGASDESFRTIENPHENEALRIDYYRMMRKWRTDLIRYGLRLTFDLVLPVPGARLWAKYRYINELDDAIRRPFAFDLAPDDIKETNWQDLSHEYGVPLEAPPDKSVKVTVSKSLSDPAGGMESFEFLEPPGYGLTDQVFGEVASAGGGAGTLGLFVSGNALLNYSSSTGQDFGKLKTTSFGGGGHRFVTVIWATGTNHVVTLTTSANRTTRLLSEWQTKAWNALRDGAAAAYQDRISRLQEERNRLYLELAGKDTLTLRRLEREEMLRGTLAWLLGPKFQTSPTGIDTILNKLVSMERVGAPTTDPQDLNFLSDLQWSQALQFGEFVKFFQQAVEWENLLYFLYPYFWGSSALAKEKMLFEHPDPLHRDFLRAGFVRIVIPVRPGFEDSLTSMLETGEFAAPTDTPYLTIAEEVQAYARTNYAGIPPANPEKHVRPLLYPNQRTTWATMETVIDLLEKYRTDNGDYPADLSALPGAPFLDAWGRPLVYTVPGSGNDYDLFSYGADGAPGGADLDADISAAAPASIMASWFEYTPTSGLDIVLNGKYEEMA